MANQFKLKKEIRLKEVKKIITYKIYTDTNNVVSYSLTSIEFVRMQLQVCQFLKSGGFSNIVIEFDNENFLVHNHKLVLSSSSVFKYYVVFQSKKGNTIVKFLNTVSEVLMFMDLEYKRFSNDWCKLTIVNCRL